MKNYIIKFTVILCFGFVLLGCTDRVKIIAKNTTVAAVSNSLTDYVGINGFMFKYRNEEDQKASFLIFVERTSTITPAERDTSYIRSTTAVRAPEGSNLPSTKETAGRVTTYETPARVVDTVWNFNVQMYQKGNDVYIISISKGGFDPARYLRGFLEHLKDTGITIEDWQD